MPYANEHAARVNNPDKYDRIRRQNNKFGAGIHVIWGIKGDKTEIQAIRFDSSKFTIAEAKAWLKDNDIKYILFEPAIERKKAVLSIIENLEEELKKYISK